MNSFRQDIYKYRKAELNDNEFYEGKSDVAGVYNKTLIWSHRETLMDTHLILLNLEFQCTCVNVGHLFIWESVIERRIKSARNHILPLQYHHCPSKNSIHTCRTILIQVNMNKRRKKKIVQMSFVPLFSSLFIAMLKLGNMIMINVTTQKNSSRSIAKELHYLQCYFKLNC